MSKDLTIWVIGRIKFKLVVYYIKKGAYVLSPTLFLMNCDALPSFLRFSPSGMPPAPLAERW